MKIVQERIMAQPDFLVEKRKVASRLTDGIAHAVSVSVQTRKEARDADSGQNIIFGDEKQKSLNNQAFSSYLVETTGIEPVTSCMSSKHSNQLSYASDALQYNTFGGDCQDNLLFLYNKFPPVRIRNI